MRKKRKLKVENEEHIDESWLIPYADLLTLLLALFIVLYAASTIDNEKYQSIMESFKSELTGTKIESHQAGLSPTPPMKQEKPVSKEEDDSNNQELDTLRKQLEGYITKNHLQDMVTLQETEKGIEVTLKDVILFDSGKADIKEQSYHTLNGLVGLINTVPNSINIEGHTDNVPANHTIFSSNWELSAARAASVLHYFETQQVPPGRMQFSGFGEYKPLYPNDSDKHRQANRRVTIVILRHN